MLRVLMFVVVAGVLASPAPASAQAPEPGSKGSVRNAWTVAKGITRVNELVALRIPAGVLAEVSCAGKGCPFRERTFTPKGGKVSLTRAFRRSRLRVGAQIAVVLAEPGALGRYLSYTARRNKIPAMLSACAVGGQTSPIGCPGTPGAPGTSGAPGATGPQGPAGARGEDGADGAPGAAATTLWAVVNSNATLNRGSRVTSTALLGTGFYEVVFNRDVTTCAFVGAVSDPGFGTALGFFSASKRGGQPNGLFIETTNTTGAATNQPFHVAVLC